MSNKFKPGDRVRRTGDSFGAAVPGGVYTVSAASADSVALDGHMARGGVGRVWYASDRFELAGAPTQFSYRVRGPHTTTHGRFDSAEAAADEVRVSGTLGLAYEIVEVSVVQTVTPRRTLEVKQ
ncbi:hypothetical protein [Bordetella bronchiseptica]|uniref:hypothetical protein n=1 Tax=Bordetella bronchiseptica TaxID=518 RepID=UPI00052923B9|nr:hypothetical protein [Bordetella bronchiseptica]